MYDYLFFDSIIILFLEGYIEFLISGYLNLRQMDTDTIADVASAIVICVCLFICIIVLPISQFFLIWADDETLEQERYLNRVGSLYRNLRWQSKLSRASNQIFMLRRMLFIYLIFFQQDYPLFQALGIIKMNLFSMCYKLCQCHQLSRSINNLDLFNEGSIYILFFMLIPLTDLLSMYPEGQFTFIGWPMVGLICFCIVVNISYCAYQAYKKFRLWLLKRKYLKRKEKFTINCIKTDIERRLNMETVTLQIPKAEPGAIEIPVIALSSSSSSDSSEQITSQAHTKLWEADEKTFKIQQELRVSQLQMKFLKKNQLSKIDQKDDESGSQNSDMVIIDEERKSSFSSGIDIKPLDPIQQLEKDLKDR